jgi:thioredoxin reductase (NADPH)
MQDKHKIIIIGSGPAGLTAAIYAARANLNPIVIAGITPGGQLMGTSDVENYPGFPEGVMGPDLMKDMIKQAEKFGAQFVYQNVVSVDFSGETKKVTTDEKTYETESVIVAVGSRPRKLGLAAEEKFWGRGVSTCATCDGAFYKDKVVVVVGGGDSAAEESTFLTKYARKVYLVHRRSELKASKIMADRVLNNKKIEVLWNTEVVDILGENLVEKVKIKNTETDTESEVEANGFFLAIGHIPNTNFLGSSVKLDEHGYIKVTAGKTNTSAQGVFVAGDVYDFKYQQAITAAGMGCMAAIDAENYLASLE